MLTHQRPAELQRFRDHLAQRADLDRDRVDMALRRGGLHRSGDGMARRQLVHYTMLPRGNHRCRENNVRKYAALGAKL
ncbi:hypothetical protein MSIM_53400 [Mycobacterium simiae]|nr:hypothetical protein MSIM_53400 [Mycobacterium simiae]